MYVLQMVSLTRFWTEVSRNLTNLTIDELFKVWVNL